MPNPTLAITADLSGDGLYTAAGDALTGDVLGREGVDLVRGRDLVGLPNGRARAADGRLGLNNASGDYSAGGALVGGVGLRATGAYGGVTRNLWGGVARRVQQQGGPNAPRVGVEGIGALGLLRSRRGASTGVYQNITVTEAMGHLLDACEMEENAQAYALAMGVWTAGYGLGETSGDALDLIGSADGTVTLGGGTRGAAALDDEGDGGFDAGTADDSIITIAPTAAVNNIWDGGGALMFIIKPKALAGTRFVMAKGSTWDIRINNVSGGAGCLALPVTFSTTNGIWATTNRVIDEDGTYLCLVLYNSGATTNDPTFLIVDLATGVITTYTVGSGLSETSTPVGTRTSDAAQNLTLLDRSGGGLTQMPGVLDEVFLAAGAQPTVAQFTAYASRVLHARRVIGSSSVTLAQWWLDSQEDPLTALEALAGLDGPHAGIWERGDGAIVFENNAARTSATRSTVTQSTVQGGTDITAHRLERYDSGEELVVNDVALLQRERGAPLTTAPAYVQGQFLAPASASSIVLTLGSVAEDGDVLLAFVWCKTGATFSGAPSGFTELPTGEVSNGGIRFRAYWKRAQDETSATYTWTLSGTADCAGALLVYRGCIGTGAPFDAESGAAFTSDSTPSTSAVTALGVNRRIVTMYGSASNVTQTAPSGQIERGDTQNAAGSLASNDEVQAASGTTGAKTATLSGSASGAAWIVALTPDVEPVWRYGTQLVLGNDEVIEIDARASDPFTDAVTPVEDTDFTVSAGSLASITISRNSGQSVTVTITAGAGGATVDGPVDDVGGGIRLRAQPLSVIAEQTARASDATSIAAYGRKGLPSGFPLRAEVSYPTLQTLAASYLAALKDPRPVATFAVAGNRTAAALETCLDREISDRVRLVISEQGVDLTGYVETVRHRLTTGSLIETTFTVRKVVS